MLLLVKSARCDLLIIIDPPPPPIPLLIHNIRKIHRYLYSILISAILQIRTTSRMHPRLFPSLLILQSRVRVIGEELNFGEFVLVEVVGCDVFPRVSDEVLYVQGPFS